MPYPAVPRFIARIASLAATILPKVQLTSTADSVQKIVTIPNESIDTDVHFVQLTLLDQNRRVLSTNFYWLPKKLSTFDWSTEHEKQHPYYTGVTSYEDLSMLNRLQEVHLDVTASANRPSDGEDVRVQIRNPSKNLAFQIHLSVVGERTGEEILPVLWEDNYLSLMPGELRAVVAQYNSAPSAGPLRLEVDGWNIEAKAILIEGTKPN